MRLIVPATPPRTTRGYDIYWQFAAERQQIYRRRLAGHPIDRLTNDPILAKHRFTNAYRAADRVSQYLIGSVQYNPTWNWLDTFVRTLVFRVFNRIDTWRYLLSIVGEPNYAKLCEGTIDHALSRIAGMRPLYSPAYIMPPPRSYSGPKYARHLALIRDMIADRAHIEIQEAHDMAHAYSILLRYDSIGCFLAYQFIIDLNYSAFLSFSENDFAVPGPGAQRGLKKCFTNYNDVSYDYLLRWTTERQHEEFTKQDLRWKNLWGRDLRLIDTQNLFCEVDKYTRVAMPDLGLSISGTRIKQRYHPNNSPLTTWFPPKWGINDQIVDSLSLYTQFGQYQIFGTNFI